MFGKHFRNLDEKRRVIIPAKFRDGLGNDFFISLGFNQTLELRSKDTFEKWSNSLINMNAFDKASRNLTRALLSNTENIQLDKQGRMMVSEHFYKKAGLTKEVVFIGLGNKIELWDKDRFDKFENENANEEALEALAAMIINSSDKG